MRHRHHSLCTTLLPRASSYCASIASMYSAVNDHTYANAAHGSKAVAENQKRLSVPPNCSNCPNINTWREEPLIAVRHWLSRSFTACSALLPLVSPLERSHGLALGFVKRGSNHSSVGEIRLPMRLLLVGQSVLHPVLVIPLGKVLSRVCTARLLPIDCSFGGLHTERMN